MYWLSLPFSCCPLIFLLASLSDCLAYHVTRLWPQAGFKHNHVDSEATPRHCHPLCPLPVAAAELLLSPLSVRRLTLSILSLQRHTFMSPASSEGKRKKNKTVPLKWRNTRVNAHRHTHTEGEHYHDAPGTGVSLWLTLWWMTVGETVGTRESVWCDWWNWSRVCTKENCHLCAHFHVYLLCATWYVLLGFHKPHYFFQPQCCATTVHCTKEQPDSQMDNITENNFSD